MSEFSVRVLSEAEWELYREMRLRALRESPEAFVADIATEEDYDEQLWRDRMNRSDRMICYSGDDPVGIASVRMNEALFENAAELFSLWISPSLRGEGLAAKLVVAASELAEKKGASQLVYWVGTDNGRAVAFARAGVYSDAAFRDADSLPLRPRHFTPGWTSRPLVSVTAGPAYGFTTMPSPPAAVSASHQSVAACSAAGSLSSTTIRRVTNL